jgi:hypothetical protein
LAPLTLTERGHNSPGRNSFRKAHTRERAAGEEKQAEESFAAKLAPKSNPAS